jgi:3-hydroxyacyl-[acyl-carrier-protein] dehydratase
MTNPDQVLEITDIMKYLPHRYPMLLVDRITACEPGSMIRGIKNVTMNEQFFQGHFPEYPVMPGVLVIEALAQIASILFYRTQGTRPDGVNLIFFAAIDNARFRRQVLPGDQLILEAVVTRITRSIGKFACRALVDDKVAAEADLMAMRRNTGDAKS